MKRYVAGLNRATTQTEEGLPDGVFLARVERCNITGISRSRTTLCCSVLLSRNHALAIGSVRTWTARRDRCGDLTGFCAISVMTWNYSAAMK